MKGKFQTFRFGLQIYLLFISLDVHLLLLRNTQSASVRGWLHAHTYKLWQYYTVSYSRDRDIAQEVTCWLLAA